MKERKNKKSSFSFPSGSQIPVEFESNISHKVRLRNFARHVFKEKGWDYHRCPVWRIRYSNSNFLYIQLFCRVKKKYNSQLDLLPTPTASEGMRGSNRKLTVEGEKIKNISPKGVSYGVNISQLAEQGFLPTPTARLYKATVTKDRGKGNLEDTIASAVKTNDKSKKINPLFLSQMMGFPTEWIKTPFENRQSI